MSLREALVQFCSEPHDGHKFSFEFTYRMVFQMCLDKKHADVHSCLIEAIERIHGMEHADWYYTRLNDIAMYYNNTCAYNGLPTFATIYETYRPKPAQFNTPPSTP